MRNSQTIPRIPHVGNNTRFVELKLIFKKKNPSLTSDVNSKRNVDSLPKRIYLLNFVVVLHIAQLCNKSMHAKLSSLYTDFP